MVKSKAIAPRRIVITGVSRGLGAALATGFIAAGHVVAGCARNRETLESLSRRWPAPHRFDAIDVSNEEQVRNWARSVLSEGPVDLLINNAALMNDLAPLWKIGEAEFARMTEVNINSVVRVIRHFVPSMVERGQGVVVNLSSGWGRSVSAEVAPYCATKFAIEGLTLALAEELPEGMAAVPLNPGIIDTDMLRQCWGSGAGSYPKPDKWATRAVPFILQLSAADNGRSASVPG